MVGILCANITEIFLQIKKKKEKKRYFYQEISQNIMENLVRF